MAMEWAVKLRDQVSGPAKAATGSLKTLEQQLRAVNKASGDQQRRATAPAGGSGGGGGGGGDGGAAGAAGGGGAWGALAGALAKVAAVAAVVAGAIAAMGVAFSKAAFQAIAFRESTIGGLAIVLKSVTAAEGVFKTGMSLALRLNLDPQQTIASLHELVSKGFKPEDARIILTAMADLKVISPKANVDALILAMSQIKSKGVLQMEELQGQMAEAGLPIGKVLDQLAKKFGKTQMDIRKMIAAGKISGDEGIFAIVAAIKDLGGGDLGASADKAANSLSGMFNGIKFRAGMIGMKLADAIGDSAAVASVRAAMSSLLEASNPEKSPAMKSLIGAFSSLFAAMFGGMDALGGAGGTAMFQGIIQAIADGISMVASVIAFVRPLAMSFLSGFSGGFGVVVTVVRAVVGPMLMMAAAIVKAVSGGAPFADMAKNIGRVIGVVVGVLVVVIGMLYAAALAFSAVVGAMAAFVAFAGTVLVNALDGAIGLLTGLYDAAVEVGSNIARGIVDGITAGVGWVTAAVAGMGGAIVAQVKATLGIASPSRVMAEMGGHVADGFSVGIDSGRGDVAASMRELVGVPSADGKAGGATGGSSANVSITVNVTGGGSGEDIGATVAARVKQELVAFFDVTSAEMGVA